VIDMGPSDQLTVMDALAATDYLLIPTMPDKWSVERIAPVLEEVAVMQQVSPVKVLGVVTVMKRYYFGGMRKAKSVQVGETVLESSYSDLLLRDSNGKTVDFAYDETWPNSQWLTQNLLCTPERLETTHVGTRPAAQRSNDRTAARHGRPVTDHPGRDGSICSSYPDRAGSVHPGTGRGIERGEGGRVHDHHPKRRRDASRHPVP
jgi:cellulose biosynthesis protein BcsQ